MRDTPRWSKSNRSASLSRTRPQARRLDANTANGRVEVDEDVLEMIRAISALAQKEAHDRILPLPLDPVKEKPVYAKADAGPAKFYSRQALDDIKAEQVAKQAKQTRTSKAEATDVEDWDPDSDSAWESVAETESDYETEEEPQQAPRRKRTARQARRPVRYKSMLPSEVVSWVQGKGSSCRVAASTRSRASYSFKR